MSMEDLEGPTHCKRCGIEFEDSNPSVMCGECCEQTLCLICAEDHACCKSREEIAAELATNWCETCPHRPTKGKAISPCRTCVHLHTPCRICNAKTTLSCPACPDYPHRYQTPTGPWGIAGG